MSRLLDGLAKGVGVGGLVEDVVGPPQKVFFVCGDLVIGGQYSNVAVGHLFGQSVQRQHAVKNAAISPSTTQSGVPASIMSSASLQSLAS